MGNQSTHRLRRMIEKNVSNPPMRFGVRKGLVPPSFALLETTGRRTGRRRQTPVGGAIIDEAFWLVAERGRRSDYVQNLLEDPHVKVFVERHWRNGLATVLPDDDPWHRRRDLDRRHGLNGRMDGAIWRFNATTPLTIRIDLTR